MRTFCAVAIACAGAQWLAADLGFGLEGVAMVRLTSMAIAANIAVFVARRATGQNWRRSLYFVAGLNLPLTFAALLSVLLNSISFGDLMADPAAAAVRVALMAFCYAPVLIFCENRFSLLRSVWETT
jgi:hypothetical protein